MPKVKLHRLVAELQGTIFEDLVLKRSPLGLRLCQGDLAISDFFKGKNLIQQ